MYAHDTVTVMPFLVAMLVAVAAMPTNVFQICAWNVGTLEVEPWRTKASHAVGRLAKHCRSWVGLLALIGIVLLVATLMWHTGSGDIALADVVPLAVLKADRARIFGEAEKLREADGSFKDDATRAAFDAKVADVERIDQQIAQHPDVNQPPVDPLDPGAPRQTPEQIAQRQAATTDRAAGGQAENERVLGIMAAVRNAGFTAAMAERLVKDNVPLQRAQAMVLEEISKRDAAGAGPRQGGYAPRQAWGNPNVQLGPEPAEMVRSGVENALLNRVNPNAFKLDENGRQYAYASLLDMAKYCLHARGVRTTGLSKMTIAAMSLGLDSRGGYHTTSDFADVLANTANRTLRQAYAEAPATYKDISRRVTLPDFRPVNRLQIGEAPQLLKVLEHGEYTRGTIGQGKEAYQLATYGRVFAITRQAIINDDTDSFSRISMLFGRSARDLESNLVWEQITSNPTMGDGVTLFHATHNNLAGSGTAIDITSVGAARAALRKQKGVDGIQRLNLVPKFLAVPTAKETVADQFVSTALLANQITAVNPFATPQARLTVIAEPRLDDSSVTAWYVFASPEQIDIVEYAYLEGEEGPVIETRVGFDVDGIETKCRHDFAAKVLDWRGVYKNPGV